MSEIQKNRDFIDFLTLLYYKKKQFGIILFVLLSAGFYFNYSLNTAYKFEIEMHVASLDNFFESDNFQRQLNLAVNVDLSDSEVDIRTLNSKNWSDDQANAFLSSLSVNGDFFYELASQYIDSNDSTYDIQEEIMSAALYDRVGKYGMEITFELDDEQLATFLQLNFINFLVEYTSNKLINHLLKMKNIALDSFESKALVEINNIKLSKNIFSDSSVITESDDIDYINQMQLYSLSDEALDENYIDYSSVGEKYHFIKSMSVPDEEIQLYRYISSNLKEIKKINTTFLFILVVFASLFVHTFLSILEDLRKQIIARSNPQ